MNASSASLRIAGLYILLFLLMGAMLPFFPKWLSSQGFSGAEVGWVLSGALLFRVGFSPFLGFWIDRQARHRLALAVVLVLMLALLLVLWLSAPAWVPVFAAALLLSALLQTLFPIIEGLGAHGAVSHGYDYGKVRLWGSVAFMLGTLMVGRWIEQSQISVLLIWVSLSVLSLLAFVLTLPSALFPARRDQANRASWADVQALFRDRNFLVLVIAAGLVVASHAAYYALSTVIWASQGYQASQIASFWVTGVVAEVLLFLWAKKLVANIGVKYVLMMGAVGALLRWGLMGLSLGFYEVLATQLLHALTFGATHVAVMYFFGHRVPESLSTTAQMVHSGLGSGIFMSAATLASGYWYEWRPEQVYWLPLGMAVLASGILAFGFRRAGRA